ncbi:hypothetical protein JG688_00017457, partial [Phytophthora aleatoria]
MASSKPRGRPPADGNFIVWTEPLVESLLRLRFEKYAEPMASAQGTKSLRVAWAELAAELTRQNNGGVMSVEQCRNKLKALRNKWLAYHSGMTSEPVCLALMDEFWGSVKDEAVPSKSQRQSRPSLEHRKQVKKPRLRWDDETNIASFCRYLYWCETNTNTVARALRRDFQRQVVVGGTANSMLSWPCGIALGSDDGDINDLKHSFYYSEYTGRVSRGSSQTVIVNEYNFFVSIAHSLFNSHHSKQPKHQKMVSFSKTSLAILFAISATSTDADVSGNLRHESRTLQAKYTSMSQYAASMLASVNAQRAAQGLPALCMNTKLMAASMRHSTDMAVNNFMSHTGSDGSTMSMRVTAAGYKWTRVAENVAAGQSSVAAVMTSWMNSPGHRANILGDYTMFGTAYAYNIGSTYKHYWTQNFGKGSTEACSYEDVEYVDAPTPTLNSTTD